MKILTRQVSVAIAGAFAVALAALCFFFVLVDLLTRRLDGILEAAVPWLSVGAYYASLLPAAIVQYQLTGLAIVIAVLAVMSTYARRNELTAMLAAGIPLHRQAAPAFAKRTVPASAPINHSQYSARSGMWPNAATALFSRPGDRSPTEGRLARKSESLPGFNFP